MAATLGESEYNYVVNNNVLSKYHFNKNLKKIIHYLCVAEELVFIAKKKDILICLLVQTLTRRGSNSGF